MKLSEIATAIDGRLVGDGSIEVGRVVHPAEASSANDLALATDKSLVAGLSSSLARTAVLTDDRELPEGKLDGYVLVRRGRYAMAGLMRLFDRPVHAPDGIHPSAIVEPNAELGDGVRIGPFTYIGAGARLGRGTTLMAHVTIGAEAALGEGCLLHPGVRIGERVIVGDRAIIHQNASLGADGFSFVTPERGSAEAARGAMSDTNEVRNTTLVRINSIGTVVIGNDVEIGACTSIDRGTVSATRVGNGTKIDDLVMIGHNVIVGENCMICGQVGIAGSSRIGDRVVLAGQVGVADHIKIGNDVVVGAGSGVGMDISSGTVAVGYPAIPKSKAAEIYMHTRRLKSLFDDVGNLKARLKAIERGQEKG